MAAPRYQGLTSRHRRQRCRLAGIPDRCPRCARVCRQLRGLLRLHTWSVPICALCVQELSVC